MTQKPETIIDKIEREETGASPDSQDAGLKADQRREATEASAEEKAVSDGRAAEEAVRQEPATTFDRASMDGKGWTGEADLLAETRAELSSLEDRFLRQAADFQNFRKRALEERALSIDIGRTQVAMPMIEVLDDLRRSLEAADQPGRSEANSYRALREGVKLVFEKFETELARCGIEPMDVVGETFDEEKHEAMLQQPAPAGTEPGTVLAEIQKGYLIGDRVLRHARVVVAT